MLAPLAANAEQHPRSLSRQIPLHTPTHISHPCHHSQTRIAIQFIDKNARSLAAPCKVAALTVILSVATIHFTTVLDFVGLGNNLDLFVSLARTCWCVSPPACVLSRYCRSKRPYQSFSLNPPGCILESLLFGPIRHVQMITIDTRLATTNVCRSVLRPSRLCVRCRH